MSLHPDGYGHIYIGDHFFPTMSLEENVAFIVISL
jgi:hypothetical protein